MRQLLVCLPNRCLPGLAHPVPFQLRMLQDTRVRQRSIKVHDVRILNYISSFKRFQYVIIYQLHIKLRDDINIYLTGVWLSRADTLPGPWVFSSVAMISYNTRMSVCSVFEYCCTSKHNPRLHSNLRLASFQDPYLPQPYCFEQVSKHSVSSFF